MSDAARGGNGFCDAAPASALGWFAAISLYVIPACAGMEEEGRINGRFRPNRDAAAAHRLRTAISRDTPQPPARRRPPRSEEHTSELQSLMRISYAVFCLKKKKQENKHNKNRLSKNPDLTAETHNK